MGSMLALVIIAFGIILIILALFGTNKTCSTCKRVKSCWSFTDQYTDNHWCEKWEESDELERRNN